MRGTVVDVVARRGHLEVVLHYPADAKEISWQGGQPQQRPYRGPSQLRFEQDFDAGHDVRLAVTSWAKAQFDVLHAGVGAAPEWVAACGAADAADEVAHAAAAAAAAGAPALWAAAPGPALQHVPAAAARAAEVVPPMCAAAAAELQRAQEAPGAAPEVANAPAAHGLDAPAPLPQLAIDIGGSRVCGTASPDLSPSPGPASPGSGGSNQLGNDLRTAL
jgi:hypothetical protein